MGGRRLAEAPASVGLRPDETRALAEVLVAEGRATYFARQSDRLRTDGVDVDKVNTLYDVKLTSSAELIAGLRAQASDGLFQDPYAERMAGQRGMALAKRFCERSPQLGGMVAVVHADAGDHCGHTPGSGADAHGNRAPADPASLLC